MLIYERKRKVGDFERKTSKGGGVVVGKAS